MTLVSCFCPHCLQKVPSNQVSYAGTKWLHWRIFSVFCSAAARSGNRKEGTAHAPTVRASLPVHLMEARRDSSWCLFLPMSLLLLFRFEPPKASYPAPDAPHRRRGTC